jgi:ATP-dependent Lon protease
MITELPMFPLNLAPFPDEPVPLHIFEPRYKQLIGECRADGITFGMPAVIDKQMAAYGTEMELVEVLQEQESGELDILTRGLRAFRIEHFMEEARGKPYGAATVEFVQDDAESNPAEAAHLTALFSHFRELVTTEAKPLKPDTPHLAFAVGRHIGLSLEQRISLLALPRETERQSLLIELLDRAIPLLAEAKAQVQKSRGNGHSDEFSG